jgi:hypothetical protein
MVPWGGNIKETFLFLKESEFSVYERHVTFVFIKNEIDFSTLQQENGILFSDSFLLKEPI